LFRSTIRTYKMSLGWRDTSSAVRSIISSDRWRLRAAALTVLADNDSSILPRGAAQATGRGKQFQSAHLRAIIGHDITTGLAHCSEYVGDPRVWDGNDISGLENNVVCGASRFHQFVEVDGYRIAQRGRSIGAGGLARASDSLGVFAGPESSGPMDGGSEESTEGSVEGRVTITVSPASLAIPPASARTSRIVTAIRLIHHGALYRADHRDGLTFSFFYADAYLRMRDQTIGFEHFRYLFSVWTSVNPATCRRTGTKGMPMDPVWLTRTSRLSSFTSKTSTRSHPHCR